MQKCRYSTGQHVSFGRLRAREIERRETITHSRAWCEAGERNSRKIKYVYQCNRNIIAGYGRRRSIILYLLRSHGNAILHGGSREARSEATKAGRNENRYIIAELRRYRSERRRKMGGGSPVGISLSSMRGRKR